MNINVSQKKSAILMIVIGLIALIFPIIPTATVGIITGAIVFILAISLVMSGLSHLSTSKVLGIVTILFGVLCFYYGFRLIFIPSTVSTLISILLYIVGFVMIIFGFINLINAVFPVSKIFGIVTLIFGILVIIIAAYMNHPTYLGYIIGLWLLISGIISLFEDKGYIDV